MTFSVLLDTESDQVLHIRHLDHWLDLAGRKKPTLVLPHRVAPVPRFDDFSHPATDPFWSNAPTTLAELRLNSNKKVIQITDGSQPSCCFPSADHACRNVASSLKNMTDLELLQFGDGTVAGASSFTMIGGEGNFWKMIYRPCHFYSNGAKCTEVS